MKKIFIIMAILNIALSCLSAQDAIIKNDGKRIKCKLFREDSLNVYFSMKQKGKMLDTFLPKSDIKKISYITILPYTSTSDSLVTWQKRLYHNGQLITSQPVLMEILKTNNEAYQKYRSANGPAIISYILSYTGGFLIGWPIGTAIGGGDPDWALAGIGAGLVVIAIPIAISAGKKQTEGINIYNSGSSRTLSVIKDLKIGVTGYGLTLSFKF